MAAPRRRDSQRWCRKFRTSTVLRQCGCSSCPDRSYFARESQERCSRTHHRETSVGFVPLPWPDSAQGQSHVDHALAEVLTNPARRHLRRLLVQGAAEYPSLGRYFLAGSFTARPPVRPSTWYPIWILRILAISAGVAVLGSTLAPEQVNPRKVHSEVVCLIPRFCMAPVISVTTSECMITALFGTKVPTPIAK